MEWDPLHCWPPVLKWDEPGDMWSLGNIYDITDGPAGIVVGEALISMDRGDGVLFDEGGLRAILLGTTRVVFYENLAYRE